MAADSIEWMLQGIITSVLSGVGFYIITRALEYAKKYCQIERQRPIFVYNCLPDNEYWQSGMNIHRRHLLNDNICNRATTLFAAYKRSSGFLCHSSPVEVESDNSVTDNALYGVPQWSNIHSVEQLPDFSLTHSLFNWVASDDLVTPCHTSLSGVRLWSKSSFEIEDSSSSHNTYSVMCVDHGDSVGLKDPNESTSPGNDCYSYQTGNGRRKKDTNVRVVKKRGAFIKKHPENKMRMGPRRNQTKLMKDLDLSNTSSEESYNQRDYHHHSPRAEQASLVAKHGASREQGDHMVSAELALKSVSPGDVCHGIPEGNEVQNWSAMLALSQIPGLQFLRPVFSLQAEVHSQAEWTKECNQELLSAPLQDNKRTSHRRNNDRVEPNCNAEEHQNEKSPNSEVKPIKKWEMKGRKLAFLSKLVEKPRGQFNHSPKSDSKFLHSTIDVSKEPIADASPDSKNNFRMSVSEKTASPTVNKSIYSRASSFSNKGRTTKWAAPSTKPASAEKQHTNPSPASKKEESPSGPLKANRWNNFKKPPEKVLNSSVVKRIPPSFGKEQGNTKRDEQLSIEPPGATSTPSPRKYSRPPSSIPRSSANVSPQQPSRSDASAGPLARFRVKSTTPTGVDKSYAPSRFAETAKAKAEPAVENAEKINTCESGFRDTHVRTSPRGNSRRSLYSVINKSESYFKVLNRKMSIQRKTVVTIRQQESPQLQRHHQSPHVQRHQESPQSHHQSPQLQSHHLSPQLQSHPLSPQVQHRQQSPQKQRHYPLPQVQRHHQSPQVQPQRVPRISMHAPDDNRNQQETRGAGDRVQSLGALRAFPEEGSTGLGFDEVNKENQKLDVVPVTNMLQRSPKGKRSPNTHSLAGKNFQTTNVDSKKPNSKRNPLSDSMEKKTAISDSRLHVSKAVTGNTTLKTTNIRNKQDRQLKDHAKKSEHRQDNKNPDLPFLPLRDYSVTVCKSRVLDTYGPLMTYHPKSGDSKTGQTPKHHREGSAHKPQKKDECSPIESVYKDTVNQTVCCSIESEPSEILSLMLPWEEKASRKTTSHDAQERVQVQTPLLSDDSPNGAFGGEITSHSLRQPGGAPSHRHPDQIVSAVRYRSEKQIIVSSSETTFSAVYQSDQKVKHEGQLCVAESKVLSTGTQVCEAEEEIISNDRQLGVSGSKTRPRESLTSETWGKLLPPEPSSGESSKVVSPKEPTRKAVGKMLSPSDTESQIAQRWTREKATQSSKKHVSPPAKLKKKRSTSNSIKKKWIEPGLKKKSTPTKKHSKSPGKRSTSKEKTKVKHIQSGSSVSQVRSKKSQLKVVGGTKTFSRSPSQTKTKNKVSSPQKKATAKSVSDKKAPPSVSAKSGPKKTDKPSVVTAVKSQKHAVKKLASPSKVNAKKKGVSPGKVNSIEARKKSSKASLWSVSEATSKQSTTKKKVLPSKASVSKKGNSPRKVDSTEARKKNSKASLRSVSEPSSKQKERATECTRVPKKTASKPKAVVKKKSQTANEKSSPEPPRSKEKTPPANKPKQPEWRESASSTRSKRGSSGSSPKHVSAALLVEISPPRARRSSSISSNDCSMQDVYCGRDYAEKLSAPREQQQLPDKDRVVNLRKSALDDVVKKIQSTR